MDDRSGSSFDAEELAARRRFRIMVGLLAGVAVTLVLLIGLMGLWWTSISGRLETARPPAPPPVAVILARAEPWPRSRVLPATLQPRVAERVPAPAAGHVTQVMVRPGTRVVVGQLLARIATHERTAGAPGDAPSSGTEDRGFPTAGVTAAATARARTQRRLAQARRASHSANLVLATARVARGRAAARREMLALQADETERHFARVAARVKQMEVAARPFGGFTVAGSQWRPGYDSDQPLPGLVPRRPDRLRAEAQEARAVAQAAEAAVLRADAAVRAARRDCERAEAALRIALQPPAVSPPPAATGPRQSPPVTLREVRAASAGVVAEVAAAPGGRIAAGQTLLRLADSAATHYRVASRVDDLPNVRGGMTARIHAGGAAIPARVHAVRVAKDGRCLVDLVTEGGPPPAGATTGTRAELRIPAAAPVVSVPVSAVSRTADGAFLWVAQPVSEVPATWTAQRRRVQLGATRGGKVAVRDGVVAGQRVIVAGMEALREGEPITVVPWQLP